MTEEELRFFKALAKDREESAKTLAKPSLRGYKKSLIEKYSDQAHFIYELLQNADDAGATASRFVLRKNRLIFAHNGTKRFTISNPATEDEDTRNNRLGDINSITSIANSNKDQASIGKFGLGFKSVFQYTQTPVIYDPDIYFRLECDIVPVRILRDFQGREKQETLFLFPFNNPGKTSETAYDEISDKLHSLVYPCLFLSNLLEVSIDIPKAIGFYKKKIEKRSMFGDVVAEFICLMHRESEVYHDKRLWLFSRRNENGFPYSVGFFVNEDGQLEESRHTAFCFFPTKRETDLNFIIHAPFLLTDSREGIKAGNEYNADCIKQLAKLSADSLVYLKEIGIKSKVQLIDDTIFNVIPYNSDFFHNMSDRDNISFLPFYNSILDIFQNEEMIPCRGGYTIKEKAYWASVPRLAEVFSDEQLSILVNNENARWVFTSDGRDKVLRNKDNPLSGYIESITEGWLDEDALIRSITASFIESQTIEWLHVFYQWISETQHRTGLIKTKPIFLDRHGKAVAAFDDDGRTILFLPSDASDAYNSILPELLEVESTENFIKELGIDIPSLKDEIYNIILPQYTNNEQLDSVANFKKLFRYYKECPNEEKDEYIESIKEYMFVLCNSTDDPTIYRAQAQNIYWPTEDLHRWFNPKPRTLFLRLDDYLTWINDKDNEMLDSFFRDLGVKTEPSRDRRELSYEEIKQLHPTRKWHHSTRKRHWYEYYLDGCEEVIKQIINDADEILSKELWKRLLGFYQNLPSWRQLDYKLSGDYQYFYYGLKDESFDSHDIILLRNESWLLNDEGCYQTPEELTNKTIASIYETQNEYARRLMQFLGIRNEASAEKANNNLTDEQRAKIAFYDSYADIPGEILQQAAEQYRVRMQNVGAESAQNEGSIENEEDSSLQPAISKVLTEIKKRLGTQKREIEPLPASDDNEIEEPDEDDFTQSTVDSSKSNERAKQRYTTELQRIAQIDELEQKTSAAEKYSYGWFKTLIELELLNSAEKNAYSREISISFTEVELEPDTSRTLILRHPSRFIPQFMEDLADIPLELCFHEQPSINLAIEVISIKSYTLRVKLKSGVTINDIDLKQVIEAKIVAKNPTFLLSELQKAFATLGYDDHFSMRKNLCKNISFIFGPPGTGKTTYLAEQCILPLMKKAEDLKILVLTPTNKAADVLTKRIMVAMGTDNVYSDWLIRFGTTNDSEIERLGIYRDKTFDIQKLPRNVTVTTIARFPYDYFITDDDTRIFLKGLKWDYIFFDEASMIPIANIIFPLYLKTPIEFIIAGDPFQIEPITSTNHWKNENIYTMVGLDSFTHPTTIPHDYSIKLLTTQYRSIPEIGEIFSGFAYGGILKHARHKDSQKALMRNSDFPFRSINIIKFPVSTYESIYRLKRLQSKSSYQIYSSLFVFELVKWLSTELSRIPDTEVYKIGIIAPYRAQADIIDRLLLSFQLPPKVSVQAGTIHGFQGDECDIVFAVFNPPPSISQSKEMFLNKLNIINVSISRARDYLFIVMPDDQTENVQNLMLVKRVEELCKEQHDYYEELTNHIELALFGSASYLEDNAFSTSHQQVNVYREPERRYEIRSEDSAVDVQIYMDEE